MAAKDKKAEEPKREQREIDREDELARQQAVRDEVYAATHNDDGTPKPIVPVILP